MKCICLPKRPNIKCPNELHKFQAWKEQDMEARPSTHDLIDTVPIHLPIEYQIQRD